MYDLGKYIVIFGLMLVLVGFLLIFYNKIPYIGKLPGDINLQRDNLYFFFPLATSILISLILTIIFWIIKILKK